MLSPLPASVAEQVRRQVERANASRALFLSLAFGLTYLVGGLGDVLAMGTLERHLFMGLQCASSFASAALVKWVVPERLAAPFLTVSIAVSAGFGGAHVAQFGGFDGPWFYGVYTVPPIFIAMLLPLGHRLFATAAASTAFTLVYWAQRPTLFDYPMAHVPLVYLLTISGIAAGLGHWVYRLELRSFTDVARLGELASKLEEQLRSSEGSVRAALARQLHDDVAQLITGARIHLDAGGEDQVARLSGLLDALNARARSMLEQLRAPTPSGPLADALVRVRDDFRAMGLTVELLVDDAWVSAAPQVEAELVLSTIREALVNAVRHARATEATVSVQGTEAEVTLLVLDNGSAKTPVREGNGLRGIRERAQLLGGTLELSDYELGLRLALVWPRRGTA